MPYLPHVVDVGDSLDDEEVIIAMEHVPQIFHPYLYQRDFSLGRWIAHSCAQMPESDVPLTKLFSQGSFS